MASSLYDVEVSGEGLGRRGRDRIIKAVAATLMRERRPKAAISVAVVDDATIAALHVRYMAISGPTDVLSFDLAGSASDGIDGEVVVSRDTARREARRRRIPAEQELLRYVIHGTLHLLGYLDDKPERAREMHRSEDAVLAVLSRDQRRSHATTGRQRAPGTVSRRRPRTTD